MPQTSASIVTVFLFSLNRRFYLSSGLTLRTLLWHRFSEAFLFRRCPHSIRSRFYLSVRPSVCPVDRQQHTSAAKRRLDRFFRFCMTRRCHKHRQTQTRGPRNVQRPQQEAASLRCMRCGLETNKINDVIGSAVNVIGIRRSSCRRHRLLCVRRRNAHL